MGGIGLCAREAQQEQRARDERRRGRKTGPGASGETEGAAHPITIADFAPARNRAGAAACETCRLSATPVRRLSAPVSSPPAGARWSAAALALLAALLVAHAALIYVAVASLFPESPYNPADDVNLRQVVTLAALVLGALAFVERRRPAVAVGTALAALALALFLPGTVLTVALILLDAWLIGDALLRAVQRADTQAGGPDAGLATLVGLALLIGVVSATGAWKVHYAATYAVLAAVPVALALRNLPRLLQRAGAIVQPSAPGATPRIWLTLLGVVLVLHLLVAAKPEVGFDAQTMHLQFARMLAARHAWRHDVDRFVWADMPLGADWMFGIAYMLDGERSARLLNLLFGVLAGRMLYRLARLGAAPVPALATVTLFASAPLAFLVTGSLFSETLWSAFLLGTLLASIEWMRTRSPAALAALYLTAAGALQAKAISVLWLVPLAAGLVVLSRGAVARLPSRSLRMVAAVAVAIGVWPYAAAWLHTGNPVFPFMNAVFRSPLFATAQSFNNEAYNAPLLPWTPYELVLQSQRFIEGKAGAPGFHWLLLLPILVLAFALRRRPRLQWACMALAAVFFVAVYLQQSYLRYLLPALLVAAAAAGWALHDLPDRRVTHVAVAVVGSVLIALNLRFMYTGSWTNATLCRHCAFEEKARRQYIVRYAPLRLVSDWLNANLPDARVGFFIVNEASPAGYVGDSRAANWHDPGLFPAVAVATTARELLALARSWKLTHVVVHVNAPPEEAAIAAFRDRYTRPTWQFENYRVALITAPPDESAAATGPSMTR